MRCWAEPYCKWKREGRTCTEQCDGYVWLNVLFRQSNIPKKYQYAPKNFNTTGEDKPNYVVIKEISEDVLTWVNDGNNLYLYGNSGTGKTTLATLIARQYIRYAVADAGLEPIVYFIRTFEFLDQIRSQFDHPTDDFEGTLDIVKNVNLLIVDDLGAEKPSNWVSEKLLSIIDYRLGEMKSTIFTSNLDLSEMGKHLGDRIADRLKTCQQLQFIGESKRGVSK